MKTSVRIESKLALFGGKPAVVDPECKARSWPPYGADEQKAVARVLALDGRNHYDEMALFEKELCSYFGSKYAVSCTNGTAALHSAIHAIGLKPGDEVIVPSYTYWATCLVTRLVGAVPVFADVQRDNANLDPADIERRITKRTRAIVVVHLWGMPAELSAIMALARKYKLKVIEDCAHAHGAEYRGRKVGAWGDIGCFSMQGSKLLPAIEGGFLLTNNADLHAKCLALGHYGRVPSTHAWGDINGTGLGFKYRIHPLAAALARVRLRKLDKQNAIITRRVNKLLACLQRLPGIETFTVPSHLKRVYYQCEVMYHDKITGVSKDKLVKALKAEGIDCVHERYPLQHQAPIYRRKEFWHKLPRIPEHLPVSEQLCEAVIQFPIFGKCAEKLVDQYIAGIRKVWHHLAELKDRSVNKNT